MFEPWRLKSKFRFWGSKMPLEGSWEGQNRGFGSLEVIWIGLGSVLGGLCISSHDFVCLLCSFWEAFGASIEPKIYVFE